MQDNDGPGNAAGSTVKAANVTLQMLVDALNAAAPAGVQYAFIDNPFIGDDTNGGEGGGNIRTAFVYRTDRVDFVDGSLRTIAANGDAISDPAGNADQQNSANNPFFDSRPPLAATFEFNGEEVTIINNHFTSKGGSGALYGSDAVADRSGRGAARGAGAGGQQLRRRHPRDRCGCEGRGGGRPQRLRVRGAAGGDPRRSHGHELRPGGSTTRSATYTPGGTQVLHDLGETLPADEQYDYVFEGNAQTLDHLLVSGGACRTARSSTSSASMRSSPTRPATTIR